jgi:flagellar motor switch protein FliM
MSPAAGARRIARGHGLIAVLEDRDGARGLIALSHGTIDALVEVQTTGRVDPTELPPRPVTRIDEALCRDFIDLSLAAFSRETRGRGGSRLARRMSFGSRIADRRQLNLLLPDRTYHRLTAEFDLGEDGRARRAGGACSAPHPRDPRRAPCRLRAGTRPRPGAGAGGCDGGCASAPRRGLVRTTRSLREVEALAPGDLIEFDPPIWQACGWKRRRAGRAARAAGSDGRAARAQDDGSATAGRCRDAGRGGARGPA